MSEGGTVALHVGELVDKQIGRLWPNCFHKWSPNWYNLFTWDKNLIVWSGVFSNLISYVRLVWGVKVKCPWTIANWLSSLVHLSTPPKVGWDQKSVDLGPARAATNCLSSLMPSCPITQGLLHTPFFRKKSWSGALGGPGRSQMPCCPITHGLPLFLITELWKCLWWTRKTTNCLSSLMPPRSIALLLLTTLAKLVQHPNN